MLRNTTQLEGFTIRATDGELGTVDQLYFDDETWAIRYLTVATTCLGEPPSTDLANFCRPYGLDRDKRVDVALTKRQVENSPTSTRISQSPGSTRSCTAGITDIPVIGVVPSCGGQ